MDSSTKLDRFMYLTHVSLLVMDVSAHLLSGDFTEFLVNMEIYFVLESQLMV